jgi:predicted TIM-barrel fold metal-dependent hydrolase
MVENVTTAAADKVCAEKPFLGQILDGDGHMYMDVDTLREIAGPLDGGHMVDFIGQYTKGSDFASDRARNRSELWNVKGIGALGAVDAVERVEALDAMGVRAQLAFYNTGSGELRIDSSAAREACRRYNDYGLEWQRKSKNRVRVAMQINMGNVDWALDETKRVIKAGAKIVTLPSAVPPSGVSPAHETWDPLWALLQEASVPATLHLGSGGLMANKRLESLTAEADVMMPDRNWGNAAALRGKPANRAGGEEAISPYFMLVAHNSAEVFLTTLIMGSVFERFPRLRFGIIELGASWVGPAVERMDLWADFMGKVGRKYDLKPSEYIERNVRVTPFWNENLAKMIERYGLAEAYIFSTDYPHLEGSRDPYGKFGNWLRQLPQDYPRKFYVDNARMLFPDL